VSEMDKAVRFIVILAAIYFLSHITVNLFF